jgi:hypothetical protein
MSALSVDQRDHNRNPYLSRPSPSIYSCLQAATASSPPRPSKNTTVKMTDEPEPMEIDTSKTLQLPWVEKYRPKK